MPISHNRSRTLFLQREKRASSSGTQRTPKPTLKPGTSQSRPGSSQTSTKSSSAGHIGQRLLERGFDFLYVDESSIFTMAERIDAIAHFRGSYYRGKPIEWVEPPSSDPPTITIYHKKTERIEIREIRPHEQESLRQHGNISIYINHHVSGEAIPLIERTTVIYITEQDILNQTIFESEHT